MTDYALQVDIQEFADSENTCSFCSSRPAGEFDLFMKCYMEGLREDYNDADSEGVYYDGREGGYQAGPQWDTYELVDEYWDVLTGPGVLDAVKESVHDKTWVRRNFG